jgi:hypothetical protein
VFFRIFVRKLQKWHPFAEKHPEYLLHARPVLVIPDGTLVDNATAVATATLSVPEAVKFTRYARNFVFEKFPKLVDSGQKQNVGKNWGNWTVIDLDAAI